MRGVKRQYVNNVFLIIGMVLIASMNAIAQWNEGMDPREEEYFGSRMRGNENGLYQRQQKRAGIWPIVGGIIGGFFIDRFLSRKAEKKLKNNYEAEKKALEAKLVKYRNGEINKRLIDLANLEALVGDAEMRIEELQQAAVDAGMDLSATQMKIDYEEFQQPDANRDDRISRTEFDAYIKEYLRQYPHLRIEDMPRFEDFDSSRDGYVTFAEWQLYLEDQRREEAALNAAEQAKKQGNSQQYNSVQYRRT